MLALVALLMSAAVASAAAPQIEGRVTSAVTEAPLGGVEVCQYADEGGNGGGCTKTDGSGDYTLPVGRAGVFVVSFDTTVEGLVPRTYYHDAYTSREAKTVGVAEGATVSGVDEAIRAGGRIAGEVTSAATKAPLVGVEACAQLPNVNQSFVEPHRECAKTNGAGEYLIQSLTPGNGVPDGGYEVEFTSPADYVRQYYKGQFESWSETLIPISLGATVAGVDAELEEGGTISGTVTSQVAGEPVGEAEVCAEAVAFPQFCVKTNAKGEYTIAKLPSHEYRVHFSGPGGLQSEYIPQYYKEKEWPETEPVNVTAPHAVTGIDASLKEYGRISGTVVDKTTKKPIEGVNVCLAGGGGCELTDASGDYTFHKLTAGTYALDFYAFRLNEEQGTNYLSQYESWEYIVQEELKARNPEAADVQVKMGGDAVIDDELEQGGEISGKMLDAKTKKTASLWPCAEDLSTGHPANARVCPVSIGEGTYTIKGLPPGRYRVHFGGTVPAYWFEQFYKNADLQSEATEVVVASGAKLSSIDASLTANPDPSQGAIAGRVTDASTKAAIAGIEVCAFRPHAVSPEAPCVSTGAKGEYLLPGLWDGSYEVEYRSPAGGALDYVHARYGGGMTVETLDGRLVPSIDGQLTAGGAISGVVTNSATAAGASGVSVCAYGGSDEPEECTTSEAAGVFRLAGLAAGSYSVGFETSGGGGAFIPRFYKEAKQRSEAQPVTVETGNTTGGIDESLVPGAGGGKGALAGVVTDESTHAPIRGIEVCAYKYLTEEEELPGELEELFGTCTSTAADGHYLLAGLTPGLYELEFSSPPDGTVSYLRESYDEGAPVTVTADEVTSSLDVALAPAGRISGTVTTATGGHPLGEVFVCAFSEGVGGGCAMTTAAGTYVITGLPAGSYIVGFDGTEQDFAIQYYNEAAEPSAATTVTLAAGQTAAGIDARLQPGASIGGSVHSAATGRAMEGVLVCALSSEEAAVGCAFSEEGGAYDIRGLPTGEWRVGFDAGRGYQIEYWREVSEYKAATPVAAVAGSSVSGIDATMRTGGARPVPPPVRTPVPPAAVLTQATSGVLGSVSSKPAVSLTGHVKLSRTAATVRLRCRTVACSGTLELTEKVEIKLRHGRRRTETVTLARGSFTLAAGAERAVHLRLTREGRRRLSHARRHPVSAALTIALGGSTERSAVRIR